MRPTRAVRADALQAGDLIDSGNPLEPWSFLMAQEVDGVFLTHWAASDRQGGTETLPCDRDRIFEVLM